MEDHFECYIFKDSSRKSKEKVNAAKCTTTSGCGRLHKLNDIFGRGHAGSGMVGR